jgi:hypothetical protein
MWIDTTRAIHARKEGMLSDAKVSRPMAVPNRLSWAEHRSRFVETSYG